MGNWRILLPLGGKNGITQHWRNRWQARLAYAARRHNPVGRRLQMHSDLARRSIDVALTLGSLPILFDRGQEDDWFASESITALTSPRPYPSSCSTGAVLRTPSDYFSASFRP